MHTKQTICGVKNFQFHNQVCMYCNNNSKDYACMELHIYAVSDILIGQNILN